MSLFLVMILLRVFTVSPSSFFLITKKYFESSSKWSSLVPVKMTTRLVLQSTSVGCFIGSLQQSLQDRLFQTWKKLRRCRRSRTASATFRSRVVQRKSFTLGLSVRVWRRVFKLLTEVLRRQQTPMPNISLTFSTAQNRPLDSISNLENPCFLRSESSTRRPSISQATIICSDVVLGGALFLTAINLHLLKDFLQTIQEIRRSSNGMMQYEVRESW